MHPIIILSPLSLLCIYYIIKPYNFEGSSLTKGTIIGCLAVAVYLPFGLFFPRLNNFINSVIIYPLSEEIAKLLALYLFFKYVKTPTVSHTIYGGLGIGIGFSLIEDLSYILLDRVTIFRIFLLFLGHPLYMMLLLREGLLHRSIMIPTDIFKPLILHMSWNFAVLLDNEVFLVVIGMAHMVYALYLYRELASITGIEPVDDITYDVPDTIS